MGGWMMTKSSDRIKEAAIREEKDASNSSKMTRTRKIFKIPVLYISERQKEKIHTSTPGSRKQAIATATKLMNHFRRSL